MSLPYGYSIKNALEQGGRYSGPTDPEGVCADALKAIGLTENAIEPATRVRVYLSDDYCDTWGVDVPQGLAEEFAKQLWKDSRTSKVLVSGVEFPKPVEAVGKSAEDVQKEFDAFKAQVLRVALNAKREEDWCDSGFKRALEELGLEVPSRKVRVVLEIDLDEMDGTDVNPDDLNAVKSFLNWDLDAGAIADSVVSVEPIKD